MLTRKAPAKINWFLHILGVRRDGFHEIRSLIQKINLYDVLTFAPSKSVILRTDAPIPVEQNLAYRAAVLLKSMYGVKEGITIKLNKNIPMGAGLGGGSSDAAAVLLGLNELWSLDLSLEELYTVAGQLGSDVPFFINKSMAYVCGRGEKIRVRMAERPLDIVLVKPPFDVSTKWAYKNFSMDRGYGNESAKNIKSFPESANEYELTKKEGKVNNIEHFIRNIEKAELSEIAGFASNDLEAVVTKKFPAIAGIKERLKKLGSVFSLMSGSGSAVFGVYDSRKKAEEASRSFGDMWTTVVQTIID